MPRDWRSCRCRFFGGAGVDMAPGPAGLAFLASVIPIASEVVDRLDQVPARLSFLFDYDPMETLADEGLRVEMQADGGRAVVSALADELQRAPRLDREKFRAVSNEVKARTGQKGRALFHPIRAVLTGRAEGPELDLAIPAIDRGAELPADAGIPKILGNRERAAGFLRALDQTVRIEFLDVDLRDQSCPRGPARRSRAESCASPIERSAVSRTW